MKLKAMIAAFGMCIGLSACHPSSSGSGDGILQEEDSAVEDATQADNSPAPKAPQSGLLFDGQAVVLPFKYTQRFDRVKLTKSKRSQRQVMIEFVESDMSAVAGQIDSAMQQAGYAEASRKDERGGVRIKYTKKGALSVFALLRSRDAGPKLRDTEASGSVYFTVIQRKPKAAAEPSAAK